MSVSIWLTRTKFEHSSDNFGKYVSSFVVVEEIDNEDRVEPDLKILRKIFGKYMYDDVQGATKNTNRNFVPKSKKHIEELHFEQRNNASKFFPSSFGVSFSSLLAVLSMPIHTTMSLISLFTDSISSINFLLAPLITPLIKFSTSLTTTVTC